MSNRLHWPPGPAVPPEELANLQSLLRLYDVLEEGPYPAEAVQERGDWSRIVTSLEAESLHLLYHPPTRREVQSLVKRFMHARRWPVRRKRMTPRKDRPRCGARTRTGNPCKARAVWDEEQDRPVNGRCRRHGGMSTGPVSEEGREAIRESNRRRRRGH